MLLPSMADSFILVDIVHNPFYIPSFPHESLGSKYGRAYTMSGWTSAHADPRVQKRSLSFSQDFLRPVITESKKEMAGESQANHKRNSANSEKCEMMAAESDRND